MLAGRRIVTTRATHPHSRLSALLKAQGAEVIEYPCIAIAPPENDAPLREALARLDTFDWLVLTSANTVLALVEFCPLPPARRGSAAVGPATAKAAREYLGLEAVLLPETFAAEALGNALPIQPGEHVLIPASAIARPQLADLLRERGAHVTVVEAYRTVPGTGGADLSALLAQKRVDAVTFTSASTVENFLTRLSAGGGDRGDLVSVRIACIGPQTAARAESLGLTVDIQPTMHTLDGLVAALGEYFSYA